MFDFDKNLVSVFWRNKRIDPGHEKDTTKVKILHNTKGSNRIKKGDTCYLIQVRAVESKQATEVPAEIATVIKEFSDVFDEPQGLPPHRSHDHKSLLNLTVNQSIPILINAHIPINLKLRNT